MNDLENRLARLTLPEGRPPVLPDADVAYTLHDTPIGTLLLATAGGKVVASSFGDEETMTNRLSRAISPRVLRQPRPLDDVRRQLDEYLDGRMAHVRPGGGSRAGDTLPAARAQRSAESHQLRPYYDVRAAGG